MKEVDIDRLEESVDAFQKTVSALQEIHKINQEMKDLSESMQRDTELIVQGGAQQGDAIKTLSESVVQLNEEGKENIALIKEAISSQTKELNDIMAGTCEQLNVGTEKVADECARIDARTEEFTGSTLKSIDGLRIQNSDNAREIRDKIIETGVAAKAQTENLEKAVAKLEQQVSSLQKQCGKLKGWNVVATLAALTAAVGAFLPFIMNLLK